MVADTVVSPLVRGSKAMPPVATLVGVPDSRWGEVGHAYCVPAPGERIDADALREWGAQRLADFKLPRRFFEVAELPRTETGKIKKHELRG